MITLSYIDYDEALAIYYKTVEKSGGGMVGVRDEDGIKSTLEFVQDDLYYPEIADKAAYLMFSLCRGHYFADCNKRISITLTANFFLKNGYMYLLKNFMEEMEAIGYHVAAGHIDRDLLTEVMRCIVNDEDYSESIKLDLIEAMSREIGFAEDETNNV
ncbi:MAG: type II toxin-antitoxin system death-on-curing family toxin [Prevotella sp.]|nr:type II toxin-antitoxin system death-on-curing family toxin [Prevotella sp.]MBQ6728670.1 type II toxin-antitoxin system death-on-curing family toxin [Bacteroidales bacterium]